MTGLVLGTTGQLASAAPHHVSPPVIQVGYTDSVDSRTAFAAQPGAHLPLGARAAEDGKVHRSRVYATFDLSQFASGGAISRATLTIRELFAADCSKRAIEVWRTKPVDTTPSWIYSPVSLNRIDEILTPGDCPATITFDVAEAVLDAVAHGKDRVTFKVKVPDHLEGDVSYGRTLSGYAGVRLSVTGNSTPTVDGRHLYQAGFACDSEAPYPTRGVLAGVLDAVGGDPDPGESLTHEFAVWPVDEPSARTVYSREYGQPGRVAGVTVLEGNLTDGRTYLWQVRVSDGVDTSAWSKECGFTADRSAPAALPQVTSTNYPIPGGIIPGRAPVGQPGVFTFSGGGDPDVAGFEYVWGANFGAAGCTRDGDVGQLVCTDPLARPGTVRASAPGGSATVTLMPPAAGLNQLMVRSIDLAGNRSTEHVTLRYSVPDTRPSVTLAAGDPVTLRFAPHASVGPVTAYEYTLDGGAVRTVPAAADGTATVMFTAGEADGREVVVRSRGVNGWVSSGSTFPVTVP